MKCSCPIFIIIFMKLVGCIDESPSPSFRKLYYNKVHYNTNKKQDYLYYQKCSTYTSQKILLESQINTCQQQVATLTAAEQACQAQLQTLIATLATCKATITAAQTALDTCTAQNNCNPYKPGSTLTKTYVNGGSMYYFSKQDNIKLSYDDAKAYCTSLGMHLVDIDSGTEQAFVYNTLDSDFGLSYFAWNDGFWIGVESSGGSFNSLPAYWDTNGPKDEPYISPGWDCGIISGQTTVTSSWVTEQCTNTHSFVCEKELEEAFLSTSCTASAAAGGCTLGTSCIKITTKG